MTAEVDAARRRGEPVDMDEVYGSVSTDDEAVGSDLRALAAWVVSGHSGAPQSQPDVPHGCPVAIEDVARVQTYLRGGEDLVQRFEALLLRYTALRADDLPAYAESSPELAYQRVIPQLYLRGALGEGDPVAREHAVRLLLELGAKSRPVTLGAFPLDVILPREAACDVIQWAMECDVRFGLGEETGAIENWIVSDTAERLGRAVLADRCRFVAELRDYLSGQRELPANPLYGVNERMDVDLVCFRTQLREYFELSAKLAGVPAEPGSRPGGHVSEVLGNVERRRRRSLLWSSETVPDPSRDILSLYMAVRTRCDVVDARLRLAACALAIRRHRVRTGSWPESLADLDRRSDVDDLGLTGPFSEFRISYEVHGEEVHVDGSGAIELDWGVPAHSEWKRKLQWIVR